MSETTPSPELIFGLVGPIGSNIERLQQELVDALKAVDYKPHVISLSAKSEEILLALSEEGDTETLRGKIKAGNRCRELTQNPSILADAAVSQIRHIRQEVGGDKENPLPQTAYIIRQLKNSAESDQLKRLYGRQFVQISISEGKKSRTQSLMKRLREEKLGASEAELEKLATELIEIDEDENEYQQKSQGLKNPFGQAVGDIFHRSDFFVNANEKSRIKEEVSRFVQALFGSNYVGPTRCEFGSFMAKVASLRSNDLSRQVGAAILSKSGDIISIGCNEVAKPGGGNYWADDADPKRDIDQDGETNKVETNRIIHNFLETLKNTGKLKEDPKQILSNSKVNKAIKEAMISDITEYGRVVHAEMNAITDAARLGRAVKGATIYVTTFPCHNCAKHIIASGIDEIIFIEPYPKSKTLSLYEYAISDDGPKENKVEISHFSGISPARYSEFFEKGKRRNSENKVESYYKGRKFPRVEMSGGRYTEAERFVVERYIKSITPQPPA